MKEKPDGKTPSANGGSVQRLVKPKFSTPSRCLRWSVLNVLKLLLQFLYGIENLKESCGCFWRRQCFNWRLFFAEFDCIRRRLLVSAHVFVHREDAALYRLIRGA